MMDLIGLGSAIVDFAPTSLGAPLSQVTGFVPYAGGAVANLLVAASRLGLKTGFLGCVGDDEFGVFLLRDFESEGVDISCVKRVRGIATGIAFYNVDKRGEQHYVFYRFPGYSNPESRLKPDDIDADYISPSRAIHFSEALLRRCSSRQAVLRALEIADEHGLSVSYDPNVRPALWDSPEEFSEVQESVLGFADIFLSTTDEAMLLTDTRSTNEALDIIMGLGPSTIVLRQGEHYRIVTTDSVFEIPIFKVKAVDTAGAGDTFSAGFQTGLLKGWSPERAVKLGASVASLKVMDPGTRKGLPRMEEALRFIKERST
jgi:sugar/nucleoside kinase (ribokinase family)